MSMPDESTDAGGLPADFRSLMDGDLLLSLARSLMPAGAMTAEVVMRADALLDVPAEERTERFSALLDELMAQVDVPDDAGDAGADDVTDEVVVF